MAKAKARGKSSTRKSKSSTRKAAAKKKRPTRKAAAKAPRLSLDEIDRRLAIARAAAAKVKIDRSGLQSRLLSALEVAQQIAIDLGFAPLLKMSFPPRRSPAEHLRWRGPWIVLGEFIFRSPPIGYAELWRILDSWTRRKLERRINKDRFARLRVDYLTTRNEREEYTLAETGAWQLVLARAQEQCDPSDTETSHPGGRTGSLASRYPQSRIASVRVWLAEGLSADVSKFRIA